MPNKELYINFSPRKNLGDTMKLIETESQEDDYIIYSNDIKGCIDCKIKRCVKTNCILSDNDFVQYITSQILSFKKIHFCFPVYCNMPTPSFISLVSRLSMLNEYKGNRRMFNECSAYIHVIADVSGTQSAGNCAMSALNMLGFTIPPRAVRSYVKNWSDTKVRGGDIDNKVFVDIENFKTLSES